MSICRSFAIAMQWTDDTEDPAVREYHQVLTDLLDQVAFLYRELNSMLRERHDHARSGLGSFAFFETT